MEFKVDSRVLDKIEADCEFIVVIDKKLDHKWVKDRDILERVSFKGASEEVAFLPHIGRVYVGSDSSNADDIRVAISSALKSIEKVKYHSIKIGLYMDRSDKEAVEAIVEGIKLGSYRFDRYKSEKRELNIESITISTEEYSNQKIELNSANSAIREATIISDVTNSAKELVNMVPDDATPEYLAKIAEELANKLEDVKVFIGDESFLKEQSMGAFLAVSRSSVHKPRFIHLTYTPKDAKERFVFVGKGLTYDSGGLSLKPSEHMVSMKADKSGAAAVLSILEGAAKLKLPFEIHAIIGACENMIGADAYKPDDVLVAKNGKTIEVRNTDAEGRLVLADCLCYANSLKPNYIIDIATLTGACVVGVGEYTVGVMGHNSKIKHQIIKAATKSGELTNILSFNRYLKKLLKSDVADISNIGSSRYGGAITAALFLDNFIDDKYKDNWIHLDIAGPAYVTKDWGYNQSGASGAGVRMSLYWLRELVNRSSKEEI